MAKRRPMKDHYRRNFLHGFEALERRDLLAVLPPTGELTEGNASAWEAFADGSTGTVVDDTTHVRVGTRSIKLDTNGGFDTGVRFRAPAEKWDLSGRNLIDLWVYGDNNTPNGWQGNQPILKLVSASGSLRLEPNQQMMPNHSWAFLTIPFAGDQIWQATTQGTFDIANVSAIEFHQDTWDFGFVCYYDGVRFDNRGPLDSSTLSEPKGVAVDFNNRVIVAESAAHRVRILSQTGDGLMLIGAQGSADGQFQSPADVAINSNNRIFVVDSGNNRIQSFTPEGVFLGKFGTNGNLPGQLFNPLGIGYEASSNKFYVADSGNHRVQRFAANGALDATWGTNGIVGTTGVIQRDHSGFDSPSDVAVNPVNGNVYVADRGNQRIEVFSQTGIYIRTYLAVFQPNSIAFDSSGNLYIAGDDPNEGYKAFDGRLRYLRAGDELISRHYTGGVDDIGRKLMGVAVRPDGKILFSDTLKSRLVKVDPSFDQPISNISVKSRGTSVTITWSTPNPGPNKIQYGSVDPFENILVNNFVTRTHAVTINNVTPNTRLFYSIAFTDSFTGEEVWTTKDVINTGAPAGSTDFLRLKAAGLIYTDIDTDAGYSRMPQVQIDSMRDRFLKVADFYWRNSGFKLWIDFTIVEVDADLTAGDDLFPRMETDLTAQGFGAADDFDGIYSASPLTFANLGGGAIKFGRLIGAAIWVSQSDFVAIHEVNHSIDSNYSFNDLGKYEGNHGIWAVPNGLGHDYSINGQILRNMFAANFTATRAPFTKWMTAPDSDNDGLPDTSPNGLTRPLSVTETTLTSSPTDSDSDNDGLSDYDEAKMLTNASSNPNAADTDADGIRDSVDLNPLYKINDRVRKGTPSIDGTIGLGESWTIISNQWGFNNSSLVSDNNLRQGLTTTYAAWDDTNLYFALKGPGGSTQLRIDGDADNWFMGSNNYQMNLRNDFSALNVSVNAGVPDVFRQIDNDGQFSEFFDTDPKFTQPYNGRTIFNHSGEGLGFPGRLVTEADLTYQRGGSGNEMVWEVRIPWSNKTGLRGSVGKELAFFMDIQGDRLFETDHFAKIRLVSAAQEPPLVTLNGNATYEENAKPILVSSNGLVVDYDSLDLSGGKLTVSDIGAGSMDRTAIQHAGFQNGQIGVSGSSVKYSNQVIGTFTGGAGATPLVISLNANATPAKVQSLLRSISFESQGDTPKAGVRQLRFVLTDGDGGTSLTRTALITVTPVNDAPVLAPAIGGSVNYQQNAASIGLLPTTTLTDPDSSNFAGGVLLVRIVAGQNTSNRLTIGGSFVLSGSDVQLNGTSIGTLNNGGGVGLARLEITFNSNASKAIVQQLIRSIRFQTVNGTSTAQRLIDFTVSDGDGGLSNKVRKSVNII